MVEHRVLQSILQGLLDFELRVRTEASNVVRSLVLRGCSQSANVLLSSGVLDYLKLGLEDLDRTILSNSVVSSVFLIHHNSVDPGTLESSRILPALESMLYKPNAPLSDCLIEFFNQIETLN